MSKIDDVIISFNDFAKSLYDASEDNSVLSDVIRNITYADNFGGNNKSEGYTNMVDLAGIVNAGAADTMFIPRRLCLTAKQPTCVSHTTI